MAGRLAPMETSVSRRAKMPLIAFGVWSAWSGMEIATADPGPRALGHSSCGRTPTPFLAEWVRLTLHPPATSTRSAQLCPARVGC